MGYAFLKGLVSVYGPDQILVTDVNKSKREAAARRPAWSVWPTMRSL